MVECSVLALLHHVVLEHRGGLGVVSVEAIENGLNVSRAGLTLVKGDTHLVGDAWVRKQSDGDDGSFILVGFFDCGPESELKFIRTMNCSN